MQNKKKDVLYCGVDKDKIEKAEPVMNATSLELFVHWIEERYKVHIKKDVKHDPQPWTNDRIIENYRFTNVRREQDRQTKYLIDNIVNNNKLTLEEKIVNCTMFRYWNLWDTMKLLGGPWGKKEIIDQSAHRQALIKYTHIIAENPRHGFFTKAFFTSGAKMGVRAYFDEPNMVLGVFNLAKYMYEKDIPKMCLECENQLDVFMTLNELPGIANFLGYQIFVDLTYIPEFPFSENEFTIAGPGCKKGLKRLIVNPDGLNPEECVFWLRDNIEKIAPQFKPMNFMTDLPEEERHLTVMSLENCLCEFSKYIRAVNKEGRPKQKYIPYKEKDND